MIIKVCGMRNAQNIADVSALNPDFLGFIFYPKSPRYMGDQNPAEMFAGLSGSIKKTGVFVNADEAEITAAARTFGLNAVQLHGSETPEMCSSLKDKGFVVIKAFSIAEAADFDKTTAYQSCADLFVFDTKTPAYGGSGQKFDWLLLNRYTGSVPFLLSGGVGPDDADAIKTIQHPAFAGLDLNSRFETEPAFKNVDLLKEFLVMVR